MTVEIAPERDGLRNLKNKLVQLGHHVVPLGIEYPASDPFSIRNQRDLNVSSGDQALRETERSFSVSLKPRPIDLCVDGPVRRGGQAA